VSNTESLTALTVARFSTKRRTKMDEEKIVNWALKEIKPKHKIEKGDPLKQAIIDICDKARDLGNMPEWLIESTLISAAKHYYRK
jgi:hypothetical protein